MAVMIITTNLWAMLGITLVVGIAFGLFISNAGKHKRRWRAERRAREAAEQERDTLTRERDKAIADRDTRIAALEGVAPERPAPSAATRRPIMPLTGAPPLADARPEDGRDRLSAIIGVDPQDEIRLNEAGYYRYDQIARLDRRDERALEDRLGYPAGTIANGKWRDQARMLAKGDTDGHLAAYGVSHRVV
ncbi:MAG: hypothetical protein DI547_01825 [Sphingobium sp.]|nr:MAG: hypothetical protein DI547_01825 [Sphingobium sp.]